jgi:O-antigen/teichoic acid export membrane protein
LSFGRSLFLSFVDKYISLAIGVVTIAVVSRLLTPVDIGIYSVAAGIINIGQLLREFGVHNYILQEEDLTRSRLGTALGISLSIALILVGICVLGAGPISRFYMEPRLYPIILLMSLNFVLVSVSAIGWARLHRDIKFGATLRIGIAQALTHSIIQIVLAYHGFGAMGMACASVAGILVGLVGNYCYYPQDLGLVPTLSEWRRLAKYCTFATGGYLLAEVNERAPDLVVGRMLGLGPAGFYSRANGFVRLFQQTLMAAVAPVLMSALAMLSRTDKDLKTPFLKCLRYTTAIAWPLLTMMAILSLPIIQIAFGHQWLSAVPASKVLCLAAAFKVLGQPSLSLFSATGAVKRLFFVQGIAVPVEVCAVIVGSSYSIEAAATGAVFGSIVLTVLSLHYIRDILNTKWFELIGVISESLIVTIVSLSIPVTIVLFRPITLEDMWVPTLLAGISGTISWGAWIVVTRHPLFGELVHLLDLVHAYRQPDLKSLPPRS